MSSSNEAESGMRSAWAIVDALVAAGCDRFAIAPGSRSAPLTLAAARHPGARVHVLVDERAAAFFALGVAKASGLPSAVITTSGTATANLLPAIVEASQSGVPLIALTADRPPRLRGTGSNQTILQPGLYGSYVLHEKDLVPEDGDEWGTEAHTAADISMGRPAGPVHLNVCFDEPLIDPDAPAWGTVDIDKVEPHPVTPDIQPLVAALARGARGVILVGTLEYPAPSIATLAERIGWPLIAEPTSGARLAGNSLGAGLSLLNDADFISNIAPQIVLQIGAAPTSRAALNLSASIDTLLVLHEDGRPADPGQRAIATSIGDPESACVALMERVPQTDADWRAAWARADAVARAALDAVLDAEDRPTELRLARDVAAAVNVPLFAGSSLPVRDLDATMAPRELRVFGNRGASGIDGSCATTYGIAAASGGAVGLIGDLALLHDASAFLWAAASSNATLVVPNNSGGGIFDLLPSAALPEHEAMFRTSHEVRFADLSSAARATYVRLEAADEIAKALADGPSLIDVPIDRERSRQMRADVTAAVAKALAAL